MSASPSHSKSNVDYRICRTCRSSTDLYPLFPQKENYDNYVRALYLSTGLHEAGSLPKMSSDDGLPQHICKKCTKIIQSAMEFRATSHLSDKKLRLLFHNNQKQPKDTNNFNNEEVLDYSQFKRKNLIPIKLDLEKCESNDELDYSDNGSDTRKVIYKQQKSVNKQLCISLTCTTLKKPQRKLIIPSIYTDFLDGEFKPGERPACKICKKSFKTFTTFKKHVEKSHKNCKLLCEFCGMRLFSNWQRLRHLRAKHNFARDNSFACSYCGFQALDKEQLESHESREHTKERPYVCVECGKAFYTKRVLVQHGYRHRKETPYNCDICPKKFNTRAKLNKHKNIVHLKKKKPYFLGCYICPDKFESSSYARKHILRMHHIPKDKQDKLLKLSREPFEDAINVPEQINDRRDRV